MDKRLSGNKWPVRYRCFSEILPGEGQMQSIYLCQVSQSQVPQLALSMDYMINTGACLKCDICKLYLTFYFFLLVRLL